MPRDGRFLEKLGTYNPLLAKDDEKRVVMNMERVQHWLSQGAQPTDRVARFLEAAGARPKAARNEPQVGHPGQGDGRACSQEGRPRSRTGCRVSCRS
jgi:small subunit ribosomal protein S16